MLSCPLSTFNLASGLIYLCRKITTQVVTTYNVNTQTQEQPYLPLIKLSHKCFDMQLRELVFCYTQAKDKGEEGKPQI